MALTGLTRLDPRDFLTSEIWNALIDILEAKFQGGVGSNDLQYPLVVQGDIDFGQTYGIIGLREFWNVVNADEYASLDAAVTAVEDTGGGAVLIPPHTTISADNVSIDRSNITIFGFGSTSVLQITASSTNPLITTDTVGRTDITIRDLAMDGTGGGSGCKGVVAKRITRFKMENVYMSAFSGDFITLTNGGVAGQSCADVILDNVICSGGSDNHIVVEDVSGLNMTDVVSKSAASDAITMVPSSSSNLIQDVLMTNCRVHSSGAKGIRIVGSGAAGIDAHSRIRLVGCQVISATGLPFELGNTALLLKDVAVIGCSAPSSTTDGMRVAALNGVVAGNTLHAATADGLDIQNSNTLWVHGNNCQTAGAYGINAASSTSCVVVGNNCAGAVTDGINRTSSTSLRALENVGDDAPTVANVFTDFTSYSLAGAGTGDIGFSGLTIPANTVKTGDAIRILLFTTSGTSGTIEVRFGGTATATITNTAGDSQVIVMIRPATGGANTNFTTTQIRETGPTNAVANGNAVVDWTAAQALTFNVTANSGGTTINGIFVELMGSK